jgi:hypothetical protein
MKYVSPAIVKVYRATTAIEGGKNRVIQDSSTGAPHSVSPGYPADE